MQQPLVSVTVVTYNSSRFVLETLDSIKAQTYPRLELVISDDCSGDDTVELCRDWIRQNGDRFERTAILEVPENTGVSGNCNRAESACRGEWVKLIAGDDLLEADCIESNMHFVSEHPDAGFIFSRIRAFGASEETNRRFSEEIFDYGFITRPNEEQLHRLIFRMNYIPAATFFYSAAKAREFGMKNDERIPLMEDYPKWIDLLRKGARFSFLDKETVRYRLREDSLSTSSEQSERYRKSNALLFIHYLFVPQFKEMPSRPLLQKAVMAHHFVGDGNIFWALAYRLMILYRKVARVKREIPRYF